MKRILVVDDDEELLESLYEVLVGAGHEPITVSSAARALELLERESFDLLLSDIAMPGMDGFALAREAHRCHADMPIVLMTRGAAFDVESTARRAGAAGVLPKPLDPALLLSELARLTGGASTPG